MSRILINDDDMDEVIFYLLTQDDSTAEYLLDKLLMQTYGSTDKGYLILRELYPNEFRDV